MSDSDRRSGARVESIVVVQLEGAAAGHSIARNASERGLLIATRTELVVGDHLEITVRGRSTTHKTKARVVRVEKTPPTVLGSEQPPHVIGIGRPPGGAVLMLLDLAPIFFVD